MIVIYSPNEGLFLFGGHLKQCCLLPFLLNCLDEWTSVRTSWLLCIVTTMKLLLPSAVRQLH